MPGCLRQGKPLERWGNTEAGLTRASPDCSRKAERRGSRKRGTHYLHGFNMGLGNSRGIGININDRYIEKNPGMKTNKRRLF